MISIGGTDVRACLPQGISRQDTTTSLGSPASSMSHRGMTCPLFLSFGGIPQKLQRFSSSTSKVVAISHMISCSKPDSAVLLIVGPSDRVWLAKRYCGMLIDCNDHTHHL